MMKTLEAYPQYLYKNEGAFSRHQLERLAGARVAVAGLGAWAGGALALAQLGVGSGSRGVLRIADPDTFEHHNANRQSFATTSNLRRNKTDVVGRWIKDLVPEVNLESYPDGVTMENMERFLEGADVVVDAVDFLRPEVKLELHRAARRKGIPVCAMLLVNKGAVAYCFTPEGPDFEEFFAFPSDPELRKTWLIPASRIIPHAIQFPDGSGGASESQRSASMHGFEVLSGRLPITSNAFSAASAHVLLGVMVTNLLLDLPVPRIPEMLFTDPSSLSMGKVDLGPVLKAHSESVWTRISSVYDDFLMPKSGGVTVYGEVLRRIISDMKGCGRVLEAGVGTGQIAEALARQGVEVFGIDLNLGMLAYAIRRAALLRHFKKGSLAVGEGNVEELFFPDQFFDGYVSNNVVFDADIERTLSEAYRVLKPGGKLAISSFQAIPDLSKLGASLDGLVALGIDPDTAREFLSCQVEMYEGRALRHSFHTHGMSKVVELLKRLGFSAIEKQETVYAGVNFYLVARK